VQYRGLGTTGVQVSRLCLGTMMFGGPTDEAESIRIMHRALDEGINFFDTANMYNAGQSEVVVGRALASHRADVLLATKGGAPVGEGVNDRGASRRHLTAQLDASLKRLGTDYIDLYYVHVPDYSTPIHETLEALDRFVRQGKVLYLGCSNFRAWRVCEALWNSDRRHLARFACVQPLYNIVNRDIEVELLPLCESQGLGVISYSPLARGILTGKYTAGNTFPEGSRAARQDRRMQQAELREPSLQVAAEIVEYCRQRKLAPSQFAAAWCLANPRVTSIILGPRTMDHLTDNLGCLEVVIGAEDEALVDRLVPPGEHTGKGFPDPAYPVTGRLPLG
jgi:aryl-alcohol dehydrogenase-like predicted oxidoreductase